jgi:hypothetical protein
MNYQWHLYFFLFPKKLSADEFTNFSLDCVDDLID